MRKYSCKIDPSHGSFGSMQAVLNHVIKEVEEKKLDPDHDRPTKDFVEVTDT